MSKSIRFIYNSRKRKYDMYNNQNTLWHLCNVSRLINEDGNNSTIESRMLGYKCQYDSDINDYCTDNIYRYSLDICTKHKQPLIKHNDIKGLSQLKDTVNNGVITFRDRKARVLRKVRKGKIMKNEMYS